MHLHVFPMLGFLFQFILREPITCFQASHTKDVKNGSGPCLHGTQDEVGTTKHNWSALCQYNVTCYSSEAAL